MVTEKNEQALPNQARVSDTEPFVSEDSSVVYRKPLSSDAKEFHLR